MTIRVPYQGLRRFFENVATHQAPINTFGGGYGFLLASNAVEFHRTAAEVVTARAAGLTGDLRALVPEHFPYCFAMPRYVRDALDEELAPPSEGRAPSRGRPRARSEPQAAA